MVTPLRTLLRKGKNWEWGDQQNWTFKLLKEGLEDAKTTTYWKQFRKTRLTVDASPFALRAILEQKLQHSDVYEVVACASRSLTEVERRYSQTEREALTILWGCGCFRFFLLKNLLSYYYFKFIVIHQSLLQRSKDGFYVYLTVGL